jgi:NitT/TauT family transport system substrate-binding protein
MPIAVDGQFAHMHWQPIKQPAWASPLLKGNSALHYRLQKAELKNFSHMLKIRLAENFRALFYAPFYALKELKFAELEGVDIEWLPPGLPGGAIDEVKSGAVDLTWGGPMRVLKDYDLTATPNRGSGESLVCFSEVVSKDPFYLVGKVGGDQFSFTDLPRLQVSVVSEVPTPWFCLQADLQDAGVDVQAMLTGSAVHAHMSMSQQLEAMAVGSVDVIQLFEPYVSQALADGAAKILYAASERGPTVYTTFICSRRAMELHTEAFVSLNRAVQVLEKWISESGPAQLARTVESYFPEVPIPVLQDSISRYFAAGIWAKSPEVSKKGFDRLAHSLHAAGFIRSQYAYDTCVHQFEAR